jgi:hypothetical protein
VRYSLLAGTAGLILSIGSGAAIAATPASTIPSKYGDGLIEGRALYEAQVNFGGARENDLGPGFNFGVPLKSKAFKGTDE